MKAIRLLLPVALAFATLKASPSYPDLPDPLTTAKGVFRKAKIFNVTGDIVRIFHEGGITAVSPADLPPDLAAALGFAPGAPVAFPGLPNPFKVAGTTFIEARITAVEPDGIRISHTAGNSKIQYELLDDSLQAALGGFDAGKAAAHRAQVQKAQASAMQAAQAQASAVPDDIAAANSEMEKVAPNTVNPSIRLTAKTVSWGRSTDTVTWTDTWGSFSKTSTTSRAIAVTVTSVARTPQQVDIEVLFLWRDQQTRQMEITTTGRKKVVVVDGHPVTIAGQDQAQDTLDKDYAFGIEQKQGRRYVAWVARAVDSSGKVVAIYASVPSYEKYGYAKVP